MLSSVTTWYGKGVGHFTTQAVDGALLAMDTLMVVDGVQMVMDTQPMVTDTPPVVTDTQMEMDGGRMATDMKAMATDTKAMATDMKAMATDMKAMARDMKAMAMDTKAKVAGMPATEITKIAMAMVVPQALLETLEMVHRLGVTKHCIHLQIICIISASFHVVSAILAMVFVKRPGDFQSDLVSSVPFDVSRRRGMIQWVVAPNRYRLLSKNQLLHVMLIMLLPVTVNSRCSGSGTQSLTQDVL